MLRVQDANGEIAKGNEGYRILECSTMYHTTSLCHEGVGRRARPTYGEPHYYMFSKQTP